MMPVSDFLDPALQASRSAVERHHLFPRSYLKKAGIIGIRDTNQIANYALVEWGDNTKIADQSPAEYLPEMKVRFSPDELSRMYHLHALPENWDQMDYRGFLEKRRDLIAQVIAKGYQTLMSGPGEDNEPQHFDLKQIILNGESEALEFKSTLRTNLHTGNKDPRIELSALKTIAGFLNTNGGTIADWIVR